MAEHDEETPDDVPDETPPEAASASADSESGDGDARTATDDDAASSPPETEVRSDDGGGGFFEVIGDAPTAEAGDGDPAAADDDTAESPQGPEDHADDGDDETGIDAPFEVIGRAETREGQGKERDVRRPGTGADDSAANEDSADTSTHGTPHRGTTKRERPRRVRLPGLSPRAYEHPADRGALASLRRVRGLDTLIRKFIGLVQERSLRYLFLASAVRVSAHQFSAVHDAYVEVCDILDVSPRPELYVAQNPLVNAGAVGVDAPFIVLHSATVDMLDDDELQVVLGHELGHVLSDHVLYKTMLQLLLQVSLSRFGIPFGDIALFGIVAALREWDRKSELSADRAGLLAVQDPRLCFRVHMKLAGGGDVEQMSVDEFILQAEEYERGGSVTDGIFKLLNLLGRTHPFHVTRLGELKRWAESADYKAIRMGDYPRREDDSDASVYDEVREGAQAYRESYDRSEDPLMRFISDVGSTVSDGASSVWASTRRFFSRAGRDDED